MTQSHGRDQRIVFMALRSRNYDATVRFYRDLIGIPIEAEDHGDEGPHYEYSWHDPYFHFAIFPQKDGEATRAEFAFNCTDVKGLHARAVAEGVTVRQPPQEMPWGLSAAYLDPDGNEVGVTELPR